MEVVGGAVGTMGGSIGLTGDGAEGEVSPFRDVGPCAGAVGGIEGVWPSDSG